LGSKIILREFSKSPLPIDQRKILDSQGYDSQRDTISVINANYVKGPPRHNCIVCLSTELTHAYTNLGVVYNSYAICGHVNGDRCLSPQFVSACYEDDNADYSSLYRSQDYQARLDLIYEPKLSFLERVLIADGFSLRNDFKILELGAGVGYFATVASRKGYLVDALELSPALIKIAQQIRSLEVVDAVVPEKVSSELGVRDAITSFSGDCVVMLGVLEHLIDPNDVLAAFRESDAKYLYLLVPMFGLANLVEITSSSSYPRHGSGAHTHFFTNQSLEVAAEIAGCDVIAEWRLGSDIRDLFIGILQSKKIGDSFKESMAKSLFSMEESLQSFIDQNEFSSEMHVVFKKNNGSKSE